MSEPIITDEFDRVVKLIVDAGDAETFEEAAALLRTYRFQIVAGVSACSSRAWQAAIATAVNAGRRAMHGGVSVVLAADGPWQGDDGEQHSISSHLESLGAEIVRSPEPDVPTITFGPDARMPGAIATYAGQWVAAAGPGLPDSPTEPSVLAAIMASALAVSECFQALRGFPVAGARRVGVSLWNPETPWAEPQAEGPPITNLPGELWMLGLGHLGQAFAWLLSLLPYGSGLRRAVLQDDDHLSPANRATSMLESQHGQGIAKTRLVAEALERAGWRTALIERRYLGGLLRTPSDPPVLLAGLDNREARQALDETGFPVIFDTGLGAGPDGYLQMALRRLPASKGSAEIWGRPPAEGQVPHLMRAPAYRELERRSGDACGVEQLAGRTVATAFVGVAAACWTVGSLVRELHGGLRFELIDFSLRQPEDVVAVAATDITPLRLAGVGVALRDAAVGPH